MASTLWSLIPTARYQNACGTLPQALSGPLVRAEPPSPTDARAYRVV